MAENGIQIDFDQKKREFLTFYSDNENRLNQASEAYANLLRLLISTFGPEGAKVLSRVKNKHECVRKFELKNRHELESSGSDYNIKDYIGDLIGVRIICLYESQIEELVESVKKEFDVKKEENKSVDLYEKLRFGYKGTHLDMLLNNVRLSLPENKRFSDLSFELQIRSIVQDAWSEVDHKLKYKKQIPDELKRRIVRLAALFELADQEFEEIRRRTDQEEEKIKLAALNPETAPATLNSDEGLNAFNFLNFVSKRYLGYTFESFKVDGFVDDIKIINPNITINDFVIIFNEYYEITQEYRRDKQDEGHSINPYTQMRHMFVAFDKNKYQHLLYPRQRDEFNSWFKERD